MRERAIEMGASSGADLLAAAYQGKATLCTRIEALESGMFQAAF